MSPSIVDIIVIAIIVLSALFAFMRGFLREVLSIGAWIVAGLATWFGLPLLRPFGRQYIPNELIADVSTGVGIFLVVLVIASVLSHLVTRSVRDSALGPLDRSLGLLFGVARGAVIVCALLLIADLFYARENRPEWIAQARTLPMVQVGADVLRELVPASVVAQGQSTADATKQKVEQAVDVGQAVQVITSAGQDASATTESAETPADSGYKDADRKAMDRAMQQSVQ